ncbi:hypothetical protein B1A_20490, partial [mine drainage metagenome]
MADSSQNPPDLARPALDRKRTKSHLKGRENGRQGGRPDQSDVFASLNLLEEAGDPQNLRKETFSRKKQEGEVGRLWRVDVFFPDRPGLGADTGFKILSRPGDSFGVARLYGKLKALIVFDGEFGIDRKEDLRSFLIAGGLSGEADGKLDTLLALGLDPDILHKLLGSQKLLKQGSELDLSEHSPGLHVR